VTGIGGTLSHMGLVGDTGVVYKVWPERGGKESTQHRNALKACITPVDQPLRQKPASRAEMEIRTGPPLFGTAPVPYAAARTQPPFYGFVLVPGAARSGDDAPGWILFECIISGCCESF